MKRIITTLTFCLIITTLSFGQIKYGIRGGVNTLQIDKNSSISPVGQLTSQITSLAIEQTRPGVAAGLFLQGKIKKLFIQPEVLFSQTRVNYNITYLDPIDLQNTINDVKSEKSQYIDIPVLIGMKFGPVRLSIGPEAHIFLNSTSELIEYENYEQKFKTATYSWVADIGLDYRKFLFDIRYEGNFSAIGNQFVIEGTSYQFDKTPGRWVFTAGVYF